MIYALADEAALQMFMLRATQLLPHTRHTSLEKTAQATLTGHGRHTTTFKVCERTCWCLAFSVEALLPVSQLDETSVRSVQHRAANSTLPSCYLQWRNPPSCSNVLLF